MINEVVSDVCKYLDSYEWQYERSGEVSILARFTGENSDTQFNLTINVGEYWIGLTIWPYLLAFPEDKRDELARRMCQLNFDLKLARLAQTDKSETALCVDLPIQALDEKLFHLALNIITYYADSLYPTLLELWAEE